MGSAEKISEKPSYKLDPSAPRFKAPAGACDTHFHIIGDDPRDRRTLNAPARAPHRAPWSALTAMHRILSIERGVLVQNTVVQRNYDILIDDLAVHPNLRAVALIDDTTTDRDLDRLNRAGVRGVRFHFAHFMKHHQSSWDVFIRSVDRIAPLGWHVVVHIDIGGLMEYGAMLRALPIPVVVDHMAHVHFDGGIGQPGFQALLALQKAENIWIKLGNADRWSTTGAPGYLDAVPFGKALVAANPDRLIWGSDWPHALYKTPQDTVEWPPPDDGDLLNLLQDFAPDPLVLKRILVDNPNTLYRFAD